MASDVVLSFAEFNKRFTEESKQRKESQFNQAPLLEPRTYDVKRVIGKGAFGVVFLVDVAETGDVVAIKTKACKKDRDPEVAILKLLGGHPNIVACLGAFKTMGGSTMNIVFEFLSDTLHRILRHLGKLSHHMGRGQMSMYFFQISRGLAYVHSRGVSHMDLKPQNILLDGTTQTLRICDFGSSKRLAAGFASRPYIASRFYRAPELLLGSKYPTTSIDTWALGCVLAEMVLRQPLFAGSNGLNQFVEIVKVIGTPSVEELVAMNPGYPKCGFFPSLSPHPWEHVLRGWAPAHVADLVGRLVRYDPLSRLPPLHALLHPFFDEFKRQAEPNSLHFRFLPDELTWFTAKERDELIPPQCRLPGPEEEVKAKPLEPTKELPPAQESDDVDSMDSLTIGSDSGSD
eukprot:TRINITY_DN73792_c0_g1_i1.p1 TRINITY_DN73792_c0_g1~~TRINITY_DN73792_c0_g1_i1.p1  ORF type:complete len:435 (-),score=71.08 TRINITY_DN73792_c0_g1_i1:296-1501(-)